MSPRPDGTAIGLTGPAVCLDELHVGDLLAEGGEGRVFELPRQPHLVLKRYRRPAPRAFVDDLVTWRAAIDDAGRASRVQAAAAWPAATVIEGPAVGFSESGTGPGVNGEERNGGPALPVDAGKVPAGPGKVALHAGGVAAGVLLPRAPRRFALRHRDGTTRLASLSYLTQDPLHGEVAYGLSLPEPVGPERLGLVYALARLLDAFESASPAVGHGDLSMKNVLWSLQRGPEVFVLDCDNCDRFRPDGAPLTPFGRRRAMTPNWDDPAVPAGANPTVESDRYSLALIFLRVVGAANFPIQARQRQGEAVAVDFAVPSGRLGEALLGPGAALWSLVERGLAVSDPSARPAPGEWIAALETVLVRLGAGAVVETVWRAQDDAVVSLSPRARVRVPVEPTPTVGGRQAIVRPDPARSGAEVVIRPVAAPPRQVPQLTLLSTPRGGAAGRRSRTATPVATTSSGFSMAGAGAPPAGPVPTGGSAAAGPGRSSVAQGWTYLLQATAWWAAFHRQTGQALWTSGRRRVGVRRVALCALLDLAVGLVGLFVVAMIVSPVLGI